MTLNAADLVALVAAATLDRDKLNSRQASMALASARFDLLPASVEPLFNYINVEPALDIFRGGEYWLANGGGSVYPHMLVHWLIDRASESSAETAVSDLGHYLQAEQIPCVQRSLVCGCTASAPFEIEPGVTFIPWGQLSGEDAILKQEITRRYEVAPLSPQTAVIDRKLLLPKRHVGAGQEPLYKIPHDPWVYDPRMLVTAVQLICPSAVALPATWFHLPDWCVMGQRGMRFYWSNLEHTSNYHLTESDIAELRALLARIRSLNIKDFINLWHITSRLELSQSYTNNIEKAIDLRIAYEMTFFIGDSESYQGELSFRLAMHAAKLLGEGKTPSERKQIFETGKALYSMCSGAIHSGQLASKYDNEKGQTLLKEGTALVRQALKRIVFKGKPSWPDVLMA